MAQIKFTEYLEYFRDKIETIASTLYTSELITNEYTFKWFNTKADYYLEKEAVYNLSDTELEPVLILLTNAGTLNDPSISIETYLQGINFNFLYNEDYNDELVLIIDTFTSTYKSSIDTYDANTFALSITQGAIYTRQHVHAEEYMEAVLNLNIVIFANAVFSNDLEFRLNDIVIPNSIIKIHRTTELKADLKKTSDTVFYPATSIQSVTVRGIYLLENTEIGNLVNDICTNFWFKQLQSIEINRDKDATTPINLISDNYYIKDSDLQFPYGSLAAFEITFYKGVVL